MRASDAPRAEFEATELLRDESFGKAASRTGLDCSVSASTLVVVIAAAISCAAFSKAGA